MSCSLQSSGMMLCLRAGMDRADGDHGRLDRVRFAADQRLQVEHQLRGHDDRVDRRMRSGAVPAAADAS